MALLSDIEKAQKEVYKHLDNMRQNDDFQKLIKEMKDHVTDSKNYSDFLTALAKDVKKADQKELTGEQEKLLKQCHKIWYETKLYGELFKVHGWCETFMKDLKDAQDACKKLV